MFNWPAMTTVRDLLESGYPEFAEKALKVNGGEVPLCCVFVSQAREWTCLWLAKGGKRFLSFDVFRKECLKCQDEMVKKLKIKGGDYCRE